MLITGLLQRVPSGDKPVYIWEPIKVLPATLFGDKFHEFSANLNAIIQQSNKVVLDKDAEGNHPNHNIFERRASTGHREPTLTVQAIAEILGTFVVAWLADNLPAASTGVLWFYLMALLADEPKNMHLSAGPEEPAQGVYFYQISAEKDDEHGQPTLIDAIVRFLKLYENDKNERSIDEFWADKASSEVFKHILEKTKDKEEELRKMPDDSDEAKKKRSWPGKFCLIFRAVREDS